MCLISCFHGMNSVFISLFIHNIDNARSAMSGWIRSTQCYFFGRYGQWRCTTALVAPNSSTHRLEINVQLLPFLHVLSARRSVQYYDKPSSHTRREEMQIKNSKRGLREFEREACWAEVLAQSIGSQSGVSCTSLVFVNCSADEIDFKMGRHEEFRCRLNAHVWLSSVVMGSLIIFCKLFLSDSSFQWTV